MHSIFMIFFALSGYSILRSLANQDINYCDDKMCPYQGKHIACGKTKDFDKKCEGFPTLEDMTPYIPLILDEHNYYRNLVASGQTKCFYPAARMAFLEWDSDLAYTAEFNVRTCVFAHDQCRSTEKFPMAGQNIYKALTPKVNITVEGFITEAIFLWYEEQFDANNTLMESFSKTVPQTGHFTLLVNDRHTHVGCAFLNDFIPGSPDKRLIIFTCNYSSTNIRGMPSYKPGSASSMCQERHPKYGSLCTDRIDSNNLKWYRQH